MKLPSFNKHLLLSMLLVASGTGLLTGCLDDKDTQKQAGQQQMPPTPVQVYEAKPENVAMDIQYTGKSKSIGAVEIHARVKGTLLKKYYTEGQPVKQGQLLYLIDPAPFEADLQAAQAEFVKTQKSWKRDEALYKQNALSQQEKDASLAAYQSATANLKNTKINLGYTTVRATVDGISGLKKQNVGSLVGPAANSLLTTITQVDPIYVEFSIPNDDIAMLNKGTKEGAFILPKDGVIKADLQDTQGKTLLKDGVINFTDVSLNENTGSISARAEFQNKERLLYPNQFGKIVIKEIYRKNAIAIPQKAVMQTPQGIFAYVAVNGIAEMHPLVLGDTTTDDRWIIEKGIKAGDKVITTNLLKIRPKAPVQITQAKPAQQASAPQADSKGK